MSNYLFENARQLAGQRLSTLETLYDPWTIRHLETTGISPGWQCWEVGGGGGSIAAWLAERCGTADHVLVTDIDPRFLLESAALAYPQIEILRHDIGTDPLPAPRFDLIHARLVLMHVPARKLALERMVMALGPRGWLVVEDFDPTLIDLGYPTPDAAATAPFQKMVVAQDRLLAARSGERSLTWGRGLYRYLRANGLVDVGMEGYLVVRESGSPGARLLAASFEQIREEAVNAGFLTDEEVDQVLASVDDPGFASSTPVLFTAWGRRP